MFNYIRLHCSIASKSQASHIQFFSSFKGLGLRSSIENGLKEMGIESPTSIQEAVIQKVLCGKDVLCNDQTGSGKTLAYLLPVMEQLKRDESRGIISKPNRPRAIVMVPSRELARQVTQVSKTLSHSVKLSTSMLIGGEKRDIQKLRLSKPLDILVTTPASLLKFIEQKQLYFSNLKQVVIDEADTIFESRCGFRESVDNSITLIRKSAEASNREVQFILAAATVPSSIIGVIERRFHGIQKISGKKYHQCPSSITEDFIRVKGNDPNNKHIALKNIIRTYSDKKTIIFCNNTKSCQSTEHMLNEHGILATSLHGEIPPSIRHENLTNFREGQKNILVCTDLASRGLDIPDVDHVILFDFPSSVVEYIHRAGRTGRAGRKGQVSSLITKFDASLMNKIRQSHASNNPSSDLHQFLTDKSSINEKNNSNSTKMFETKTKNPKKGTKKIPRHKLRNAY